MLPAWFLYPSVPDLVLEFLCCIVSHDEGASKSWLGFDGLEDFSFCDAKDGNLSHAEYFNSLGMGGGHGSWGHGRDDQGFADLVVDEVPDGGLDVGETLPGVKQHAGLIIAWLDV